MITIECDDRDVIEALSNIRSRVGDVSPYLKAIGENLVESTKRRFPAGVGPDGERWKQNSPVTILQYLSSYKSSFSLKTGRITAGGVDRALTKRPLFGESGDLSSTITYQLEGQDALNIGSPLEYGAVQQFGAKQGEFGRDKRNHPIPWGDIPARPFLGVSDEDRRGILDVLSKYLLP